MTHLLPVSGQDRLVVLRLGYIVPNHSHPSPSQKPLSIPFNHTIQNPSHPLTPLDAHRQHALHSLHPHPTLQHTNRHPLTLP
ncbi:hypothetical protein BDW02DRAFT_182266 [Decorospora gaudefroyi]|uniref:Uncharacterized protein n=1 Tax=Decorospora gaudefroyi TaxID=184978 RepID=A0A6A5KMN5_9PLEO|nr:hypothetical protein BDW02DRAFT_182266 [Decorospora gaudefroyi]